ncbi:MAG TPA: helix-turn-helix domain-containing protein [Candidatus Eisenbacteria bacterium]|nr:helix-turn-helix domain-containing protein [Candidatus Eisenbacteria bacterium]
MHTLLSSNDLADRLGISRASVLRAVSRGQLRPALVTPGGHRRFLPQDAESLGRRPAAGDRDDQLLGSSEAARLLGISQQTLNRAVRQGRLLPAVVTPGGHRRFAASDIVDSRRAAANGGTG